MADPMIEGIPLWVAETNAWIVAPNGPGGECVIIDAPPDPRAIIERLQHHSLKLVALLSTHGHLDHIGGMGTMSRHGHDGDVPVHIHDDDKHMLLDPIGTSGGFGAMLEGSGLDLRAPELIYGLDDGEQVKGAGMTFTNLHTPGHTRGSTCFLLEMDGVPPILFSGDHLFAGSIGRTDMPGGSFDQLMESMAEKILPLADETAVLPGHGPTTTVGRERITNPFILELLADR
ncbi:MAG TPA: MBL fold metallo-hydrolase [Acidimicrobiales bacterium]|nr:MBL fold metallo-hydrolase [Acidimicrobiales bacterium]